MSKVLINVFIAFGGVSIVLGALLNYIPQGIHKLFGFLLSIPAAKGFIQANGDRIKQILDELDQSADKEIDAAKKS